MFQPAYYFNSNEKEKNHKTLEMKLYFLVSVIALAFAWQIHQSDAIPGVTIWLLLTFHVFQSIKSILVRCDWYQQKKNQLAEEYLIVQPFLSDIEKKKVEEASETAFKN